MNGWTPQADRLWRELVRRKPVFSFSPTDLINSHQVLAAYPTPGTEVKIISQDGEIIREPGEPGVLWVKMDSLADGYWNLPERTKEVFEDGWYCTNDMFVMNENGTYEHQGRSDDMLKISGQWVSPVEIEEEVLLHPKVSEAAVVGIPNEDGLVRLALFLVAETDETDKDSFERELQEALVEKLSLYKCPRQIYYVDAMPLTATESCNGLPFVIGC